MYCTCFYEKQHYKKYLLKLKIDDINIEKISESETAINIK